MSERSSKTSSTRRRFSINARAGGACLVTGAMKTRKRKDEGERHRKPSCAVEFDEKGGRFVLLNGVRIAKRGLGPHARTWVSLEPGYRVLDSADEIVVEYNGARVQ